MAQERGSAVVVAALLSLFLLLNIGISEAKEYLVGDEPHGWHYGIEPWVHDKKFQAGDVLIFNYTPGEHNVVEVDFEHYDSCVVPKGAKTYTSGNDRITLKKGDSYFICGLPMHCDDGMRTAAHAE